MKLSEQVIRQETTTRLITAITQDHFILYGQPVVPIGANREPHGFVEVLVRYVDEETKSLPPGGFLEVLESLRLMSLLDRWVTKEVVRSMVGHHTEQSNWNIPRYSINLSVDSLSEEESCSSVRDLACKNQLPPGKLWFEIAENDAKVHGAELRRLASGLKGIGCGIALTAYTGESFLPASLVDLGVGAIKIDGQLIGEIHQDIKACAWAQAIHGMCKKLGILTIAEMVELPETFEKLQRVGIDYAQGYAIAPPVPLRSTYNALN